jgi:hypothetical protein
MPTEIYLCRRQEAAGDFGLSIAEPSRSQGARDLQGILPNLDRKAYCQPTDGAACIRTMRSFVCQCNDNELVGQIVLGRIESTVLPRKNLL